MSFDENTTKIIGYLSTAVVAIAGGAWFAIRRSKSKKYSNKQSNITMTGDGNKVTGRDDNSTTTINK
jgi:hypothetical protein